MALSELTLDRIYLMRHANAAWARPGQCDFDRSLSDHGHMEVADVARAALRQDYLPELIISSTAKRCRQTAEGLRECMNRTIDMQLVDQLYEASVETLLEIISAQDPSKAIMLVGHNPSVEEMLVLLAGSDALYAVAPTGYPTAGIAVLDRQHATVPSQPSWALTDFIKAGS